MNLITPLFHPINLIAAFLHAITNWQVIFCHFELYWAILEVTICLNNKLCVLLAILITFIF